MTSETPAQVVSKQWAERLTVARKAAGYTQAAFAERIQRDQPWVSRYERGRGNWSIEVMILFAAALSKPVGELFPYPYGIEAIEQFRLGMVA